MTPIEEIEQLIQQAHAIAKANHVCICTILITDEETYSQHTAPSCKEAAILKKEAAKIVRKYKVI